MLSYAHGGAASRSSRSVAADVDERARRSIVPALVGRTVALNDVHTAGPGSCGPLIASSAPMIALLQEIGRIARSEAKVLITGESGVGKELVANSIHQLSARCHRAMSAVNCAGLSDTLLESELFGHVKGSFTGAYRHRQGKLEMADGGTIFLDEIGEMTLRMQGMLLRFLETGELQKVGSERVITRVDVRVIAATNKNLREMITQGLFREDLFYRLNVIHLIVPPLRERREDIPAIVDHFHAHFTRTNGCAVRSISPEAARLLTEYSWPGNVRELRNVMERLAVTARDEVVLPEHLPLEVQMHRSALRKPPPERRRAVADLP